MHIYCDGQQFNISSIYTSENIEEIINHLLTMNFSTNQDILDLYTFWGTISQQNHSDLEDFLFQGFYEAFFRLSFLEEKNLQGLFFKGF